MILILDVAVNMKIWSLKIYEKRDNYVAIAFYCQIFILLQLGRCFKVRYSQKFNKISSTIIKSWQIKRALFNYLEFQTFYGKQYWTHKVHFTPLQNTGERC
jgi:hypothetical protein